MNAVNDLRLDLGFIVLDGAHAASDVVRGLARPAVFERVGPRREALAYTLHGGDEETHNSTRFALFTHEEKTILAPPGCYAVSMDPSLELSLSQRFGACASFYTHVGAHAVRRCVHGAIAGEVSCIGVSPPEGCLGVDAPFGDFDAETVVNALLAYLRAPWDAVFPRLGKEAEFWRFGA